MDIFDALHQLGYNSLFTYVDNKRQKQYCILYGPLSLCNSDKKRDVGFTWLNRDGDEFLYENRFEEVYLREVLLYPNSPDEMEVEECRVRFRNVFFIILVRIITTIASISSIRIVSFLSLSRTARLSCSWLFSWNISDFAVLLTERPSFSKLENKSVFHMIGPILKG